MTTQEVEEIKDHFDKVAQQLRTELGAEIAGARGDVGGEITALKGEMTSVASGLAEVRGGMAEVRGELTEVRGELASGLAEVRGELASGLAQVRTETTGEFAGVRAEISEFRRDAAAVADHLQAEITESRRIAGAEAEELRSEIRAVAEGVALATEQIDRVCLRVDALTIEVRSGFADVHAELHHLHVTDDELRRRIEAEERRA